MVEVDEAEFGASRAGEGSGRVGSYSTAADDDDESVAQFGETFVTKEDAVASQLLEDQVIVVVAFPGSGCEGHGSFIFLAGFEDGRGSAIFSELCGVSVEPEVGSRQKQT